MVLDYQDNNLNLTEGTLKGEKIMKYIIYGGSLSYELIRPLLIKMGNEIIAIIDKNISKLNNLKEINCIKVSEIKDLDIEILNECDEILVALGSKEVSELVKKELEENIESPVFTVHDEKYSWYYDKVHKLQHLENVSVFAQKGWFLSAEKGESIDKRGEPIPWYTYSSIDFLKQRIGPEMVVFEFGCGNSTRWWSQRVKSIKAIENNKDWFLKIKDICNAEIKLCEDKESYLNSIKEHNQKLDIICIDGVYRNECVSVALDYLKEDGVVVFDNSERIEYEQGMNLLKQKGFNKLEFYGIGPINNYEWETSIFYKEKNILNI